MTAWWSSKWQIDARLWVLNSKCSARGALMMLLRLISIRSRALEVRGRLLLRFKQNDFLQKDIPMIVRLVGAGKVDS